MANIKVLPQETALKIAAGEVIERPAHVVKELIENSLDAGATAITLYIQDAGKALIRIVDDGCGMSKEDAQLCFLPHATSKITTLDDLESIASFGFRGEALASIAAISTVTLITKEKSAPDSNLGLKISWSNSTLQECNEVACPTGVDLSVHNLFFNTPVRKKFLKSDETEQNAIQAIVHAYALSNKHILFKLFFDETCALYAPPVDTLSDRIAQVWDLNMAQNMRTLTPLAETKGVSIAGMISHPHVWRYNRNNVVFFVNKRWVKNNELGKALMKGYLNVLPPNKFPAGVIFIDVEASNVDVNIHPKKEEVKFAHPASVYTPLATLVKSTLEEGVTKALAPQMAPVKHMDPGLLPMAVPRMTNVLNASLVATHSTYLPKVSEPFLSNASYTEDSLSSRDLKETADPFQQTIPQVLPSILTLGRIIGQLFATYIIVEGDNELIIVDQHAAHERILYEQLAKNFEPGQGTALLFPEVIELTAHQAKLLIKHGDFFATQGIGLECWSDTSVVVRTTPPSVRGQSIKELIMDVVEFIVEHETLDWSIWSNKLLEHLHGQMACKGAVKAGDVLSHEHMKQLLKDLIVCNNRLICVHGRPTMWTMQQTELEKFFRRIA